MATCDKCNDRGAINKTCTDCNGTGDKGKDECPTCDGKGYVFVGLCLKCYGPKKQK